MTEHPGHIAPPDGDVMTELLGQRREFLVQDLAHGAADVGLGAAALDSFDDAAARQEITGRVPRWGRLLRKVLPRIERASAAL